MTEAFYDFHQEFRDHYERAYHAAGHGWDRYRPAYRFGHDIAFDRRFRGRSWRDIEPDVAGDWARRFPNVAWDDVREAAHFAWDRLRGGAEDLLVRGP